MNNQIKITKYAAYDSHESENGDWFLDEEVQAYLEGFINKIKTVLIELGFDTKTCEEIINQGLEEAAKKATEWVKSK